MALHDKQYWLLYTLKRVGVSVWEGWEGQRVWVRRAWSNQLGAGSAAILHGVANSSFTKKDSILEVAVQYRMLRVMVENLTEAN